MDMSNELMTGVRDRCAMDNKVSIILDRQCELKKCCNSFSLPAPPQSVRCYFCIRGKAVNDLKLERVYILGDTVLEKVVDG